MVFDGEIRHWFRIRLVFTRPYLGTAISMSMTLAVWTYSGGSMSSVWIFCLLPLRSRFSWARLERMSFALLRASIRWSSDRSGAALEDWTGACIGAAVYPRPRDPERGFSSVRKKRRLCEGSCQLGSELSRDPGPGGRIPEALRANCNELGAGVDHLRGVPAGRNSAHRDHRDRDCRSHRADLRQGDRTDRRPGEAAGPAAEPLATVLGVDSGRF